MFIELNNVLDLKSKDSLKGKFIGTGEAGADGSFTVHHFLSFFLKHGKPACLIALAQSYNHFNTVSQKIGLGLNAMKDSNILKFVEGLKILGEFISTDKAVITSPFQSFNSLTPLYKHIEQVCRTIHEDLSDYPVIIIDDISVLLNIGYHVGDIIAFLQYTQQLIQDRSSFVVLAECGRDSHDEDAEILWKHICHSCSLRLEVSGLKSGSCSDVHGELSICWQDTLEIKPPKTMQFKLTDKNLALFGAGMSSAVL